MSSDEVRVDNPVALFRGLAKHLDAKAKEVREQKRDQALFKIPLLPTFES